MDLRREVAGAAKKAEALFETGLVGIWHRNRSHIVTACITAAAAIGFALWLR